MQSGNVGITNDTPQQRAIGQIHDPSFAKGSAFGMKIFSVAK
jgi:hypothetical protein